MNIKINKSKVFCILGPTGVGKTYVAMKLHEVLPVELISVDSGLIYKSLNIGTAKPSKKELKKIPHKLIDILDPKDTYSVNNFFIDSQKEINKILYINKKIPLMVGGAMMYYNVFFNGLYKLPKSNIRIRNYINSLYIKYGNNYVFNILKNVDYLCSVNIHPNDRYRVIRNLEIYLSTKNKISELKKKKKINVNLDIYKIIIFPEDKNILIKYVINRFYKMLSSGFEDEVYSLYCRNDLDIDKPSMKCIGYKQMWLYLDNKISYDEMIKSSIDSTIYLIKKQLIWLKKWNNFFIVVSNNYDIIFKKIFNFISKKIHY